MRADPDVNYWLHRQQISLIRAQSANSAESRLAYEGLAKRYMDKLLAYRRRNQRRDSIAH